MGDIGGLIYLFDPMEHVHCHIVENKYSLCNNSGYDRKLYLLNFYYLFVACGLCCNQDLWIWQFMSRKILFQAMFLHVMCSIFLQKQINPCTAITDKIDLNKTII